MTASVEPDTFSVVNGRPIRPLPKRRIRSRLSADASSAILSPPTQPAQAPLFYLPYTYPPTTGVSTGTSSMMNSADQLLESSDEEDNNSHHGTALARYASGHPVGINDPASYEFHPGSHVDSYDWSENTNNKKKRKIPTPAHPGGGGGGGGSGSLVNGSGLSGGNANGHSVYANGVNSGVASGKGYNTSPTQTGYTPTSATSTPRNRWKNSGGSAQRSPLSSLSSGGNNPVRRVRRYPGSGPTSPYETPTRKGSYMVNGKHASTEVDSPLQSKVLDKENLVDSSGMAAPSAHFTFACDSPVSANLAFSRPPQHHTNGSGYSKSMSTVGTQTSPSMSNSGAYPPPSQTKKKTRTPAARREYALQQQRLRQRQAALSNPRGEIWICEFCEYESIFGRPPEALMRQYDIKDRRERRRLAEKRRLLEKAKQKNKKNASRGGKKHHQAANTGNGPPPPPPPPSMTDSQGTQSDHTSMDSTTPIPALKPQRRQSQPVQSDQSYDHSRHHRTASGTGGVMGRGAGS